MCCKITSHLRRNNSLSAMGYRLPVRIKKGLEIQGMNKLKLTDINLIFLITIIYITEFDHRDPKLRKVY